MGRLLEPHLKVMHLYDFEFMKRQIDKVSAVRFKYCSKSDPKDQQARGYLLHTAGALRMLIRKDSRPGAAAMKTVQAARDPF